MHESLKKTGGNKNNAIENNKQSVKMQHSLYMPATPLSDEQNNQTNIPALLKKQIEKQSGLSFNDVRVHYNSSKPAVFQALAYTQGNQVYIGPGQEKHLMHELGHVVQQKRGLVRPTNYINNTAFNTDPKLEQDADAMEFEPFNYMHAQTDAPIQCKSEFYKGGAELENKAQIELVFQGGLVKEWPKELLENGIKGISFDKIIRENIPLKGENWNLTVELMGFNPTYNSDKITTGVTLELIVGGPKGTPLPLLPTVSGEAASNISKLDEYPERVLKIEFDEQIFHTVTDNIINHYNTHAVKKMEILKIQYPLCYGKYKIFDSILQQSFPKQFPKELSSINEFLLPHMESDDEEVINTGLQHVPPPPPSSKPLSKEERERLEMVKEAEKDYTEGIKLLKLIASDLKNAEKAEALKQSSVFSMSASIKVPSQTNKLSEAAWGLQITLGVPVSEIPGVTESLLKAVTTKDEYTFSESTSNTTITTKDLKDEILKKIELDSSCDSYIAGLAEIVSAYRRGLNCGPEQGPKHTMRMVNKNPLNKIVMSYNSLTPKTLETILHVCADMVVGSNNTSNFNWVGIRLPVNKWNKKIKGNPSVDLAALYDGAYRHGQIGQIPEPNEAGVQAAPVFEFRELSSVKPFALEAIFRKLISDIDKSS